MNFSSGDSVSARIPGSRTYSDGKVKTIKGDSCVVYFPLAEKEYSIPKSELIIGNISSRSRSPARNKSPARRSPGRPKSPSRREVTETKTNEKSKSPSRTTRGTKSPSRKEKSPSRKEVKIFFILFIFS